MLEEAEESDGEEMIPSSGKRLRLLLQLSAPV
jgi:hypothetical protein